MKNKGEMLAFYLKNYAECIVFLHTTRKQETAELILREGFIYESQLSRSTDRVSPLEPVEIIYFLFHRKEYGSFTVVIAIPKRTYKEFTGKAMDLNVGIEEVFAAEKPFLNENDEYTYRLNPIYIAGYFNINSGEFVHNPLYQQSHNCTG
jgi:hypothetical protein